MSRGAGLCVTEEGMALTLFAPSWQPFPEGPAPLDTFAFQDLQGRFERDAEGWSLALEASPQGLGELACDLPLEDDPCAAALTAGAGGGRPAGCLPRCVLRAWASAPRGLALGARAAKDENCMLCTKMLSLS